MVFNDIYYKIDSKIVEAGYWESSLEEKKSLINNELKNYAIIKLKELNVNEDFNKKSVSELVELLANNISREEHYCTISHFVHYILKILSSIQNYEIVWFVSDDDSLKDNPLFEKENDIYKNLNTRKDDDIVRIFNFVYDVFNGLKLSLEDKAVYKLGL